MYRDAQMHDRPVLMGDPRNKCKKQKIPQERHCYLQHSF